MEQNAPESFRFFNEPVTISAGERDRYFSDLRQETERLPGLVSVYQDPLVLGDQTVRVKLILVYQPEDLVLGTRRFPDVIRVIGTRNILDERYLCVDSKILENIFKFDPLLKPQHLFGRKLNTVAPQQEEVRFFYISRLLDLFSSNYLDIYHRLAILREVDTTHALGALRDLQRLLDMAKVILRQKSHPQWDRVGKNIDQVLKKWPTLGIQRYRLLMDVLQEVPSLIFGLLGQLNEYFGKAKVAKMRLAPGSRPPQALLITERIMTAFVHPWNPVLALEQTIRLSKQLEQFIAILPASFALQLAQYATGTSPFSRHIRSSFRTEGLEGNLERPYVTWDRSQLLDRYLDLLGRIKDTEDNISLLLDCEVPSGSTLGRASEAVTQQRSKIKLKKMFRFMQDEVDWEAFRREAEQRNKKEGSV